MYKTYIHTYTYIVMCIYIYCLLPSAYCLVPTTHCSFDLLPARPLWHRFMGQMAVLAAFPSHAFVAHEEPTQWATNKQSMEFICLAALMAIGYDNRYYYILTFQHVLVTQSPCRG